MSSAVALVKEVEATLRDAPIEKRTEILRRVTDLFLVSAPTADESQVAVFDGVMGQLVTYVEQKAVAELSRRIAAFANAPPMTARQMARHDNLEISGPILSKSAVLTDHDLIEIAAWKSQAHLAQIALRPQLTEKVTDALVDFGDNTVASRLAANAGARFSKLGMAKLVSAPRETNNSRYRSPVATTFRCASISSCWRRRPFWCARSCSHKPSLSSAPQSRRS